MPALRVDWNSIKGALVDLDAPYVFILPDASRQLFLAIADQLSWEATFRAYGYDYADWDTLQAVHAAGVAGLLGGVPLDELLGYIDDVESLLIQIRNNQALSVDCCQNIGGTTEIVPDPGIIFEEGDPPLVWGDGEPVSDWDDWHQLVCGAAHAYVDLLKQQGDEINSWLSVGAIVVGLIALLLGAGAGAGILLTVSYGTAAALVAGLVALVGTATFVGVSGALEAARDDIVCAITQGSSGLLASYVEEAVGPTAWTAWYQHIDYASARNVMLEGSHGGEFLDIDRREDCCECQNVYVDFGTQTGAFTFDSEVNVDYHTINLFFNYTGAAFCGGSVVIDSLSLSHSVQQIVLYNQAGGVVRNTGVTSCNANASLFVGDTGARLYAAVNDAAACGTPFTLTVTWHAA